MKDWKLNDLFDNISQCNLFFKSLVDESRLETFDLLEPCPLGWIQGKCHDNHQEMQDQVYH